MMYLNNNSEDKKPSSNRSQIALAMSGHAITDLYASFIIGLIPILAIKFDLSLFLVGLLTSITGIANSLTQPVFGFMADRYNMKYFIIIGPLFSAIFISLLPVMPSYFLVIIFLFIGNLSVSAMHPPTAAIGGLFGGRLKGLSNSLISFSGTFGYAFGSIFIISVIEKIGQNFAPLTMIPGIILTFILFKYVRLPNKVKTSSENINFFVKIKTLHKIRILKLFLIFAASYARDLVWVSLTTFMPLYFTNSGIKLINIGYILIIYTLLGGLGGILAGYFSDRIHNKISIVQAGLLISTPLIYFLFNTTGIIPVVFFILIGFFTISTLPICIRLSQDIFPSNMSLASSLVMGLSVGTASITMIFLGRIADNTGIENMIKNLSAAVLAIAVLMTLYWFLPEKYQNKKKEIFIKK
ncbi:MAG: MFS transporter [Actinobacteria bacterium]|nr:MFS transporter [Actinomycetota bacterium]